MPPIFPVLKEIKMHDSAISKNLGGCTKKWVFLRDYSEARE